MMMAVSIRVECYAGYRGEEEPRRFYQGDRCIEIASILDRWLAPDHRYFKVEDEDGKHYVLRHDVETQHWDLVKTISEDGN